MKFPASFAAVFILASSVTVAAPYGQNITIPDGITGSGAWYGTGAGQGGEDQETEPGTIATQQWDLEAMYMKGQTLTLVGGFDFKNGYQGVKSGDIFVDTNGVITPGNVAKGTTNVTNGYNFEYALDLDFVAMTFAIVELDANSMLSRATDIGTSNPVKYVSDGTVVGGGSFTYFALTPDDVATLGLLGGGTHYGISIDTSFFAGQTTTFHFTLECGNDNLMGRTTVPAPDAASTGLLLSGAFGLMFAVRRKLR